MTYPETPIDRAYDTIHTGLTGYYTEVLNISPDEAACRAQNAIGDYADLLTNRESKQAAATPQCPATILGAGGYTLQCDDVPDHWGVHTHLRTWWPNDRDITGDTHCVTTPHCRQYTGHAGPCQLYPEPTHTNEEPPW